MMHVCVVGVGNIGGSLLRALRRAGVRTSGVDNNPARVAELSDEGVDGVHLDPQVVGDVDVWIITTSTGERLSSLLGALATITPKKGSLISVESTLPVGTMTRIGQHFADRGYAMGSDIYLVHVPHRVLFGVDLDVFQSPRIIGGMTPNCLLKGLEFYGPLIQELHPVYDIRVAELSKIVENSLRYVEVAFAEEIFRLCHELGMEFPILRKCVNTKSNVHMLDVDYGIGGECLPKDIDFLLGCLDSPLLRGAQAADKRHRGLVGSWADLAERVLFRSITYKPNYPDAKWSAVVDLAVQLQRAGKQVFVNDPALKPEQVAELGLDWGDSDTPYDITYLRPLQFIASKKEDNNGEGFGDRE